MIRLLQTVAIALFFWYTKYTLQKNEVITLKTSDFYYELPEELIAQETELSGRHPGQAYTKIRRNGHEYQKKNH